MDETQNRTDRSEKAVKRTIVGGRPRRQGQSYDQVPRGIEVLTKKASVDPAFRQVLLDKRAKAAHEIALELTPAEVAMLDSIPEAQLKAIIDAIKVPDPQRRAFLGGVAAAMLAAITSGCIDDPDDKATPMGIRPTEPTGTPTPTPIAVTGIRPTDPTGTPTPTPSSTPAATPIEKGIRPDQQ